MSTETAEELIEKVWNEYEANPSSMQITLKGLREMPSEGRSEQITEFLAITAVFPDNCAVVLTQGHASLLTDDEGEPLVFA